MGTGLEHCPFSSQCDAIKDTRRGATIMRIAPRFTLALIAGVIAVHAVAIAYRVNRESELFERVAVSDATILGRAASMSRWSMERAMSSA